MAVNDRRNTAPGGPFSREREFLSRAARRARLLASTDISLVLDVGGWEGEYGTSLRSAGYSGRIVSFEPMAASFAELQAISSADRNWDVYPLALGSTTGTAMLNVAHDSKCNSFLPVQPRSIEAAPESEFVGTEEVRVERLDRMWRDLVPDGITPYLKLDVQGFELEVLEGASDSLGAVAMIEAELSLVPVYARGPLWTEIVDYLDVRGFALVSVENVFEDFATGEMLQVDGIFKRR